MTMPTKYREQSILVFVFLSLLLLLLLLAKMSSPGHWTSYVCSTFYSIIIDYFSIDCNSELHWRAFSVHCVSPTNIFAGTVWANEKFTIPNLLTMSIGECKSCFSFSRSQRHALPPPHPHTHTHPYPLSVFLSWQSLECRREDGKKFDSGKTKFIIVSQWSFTSLHLEESLVARIVWHIVHNHKWYKTRTSAHCTIGFPFATFAEFYPMHAIDYRISSPTNNW